MPKKGTPLHLRQTPSFRTETRAFVLSLAAAVKLKNSCFAFGPVF